MGPSVGLFGFLAQVNTMSTETLHACAALDISNIWPLRIAGCIRYTRAVFFSTSDRASKEVRNTREPELRVT